MTSTLSNNREKNEREKGLISSLDQEKSIDTGKITELEKGVSQQIENQEISEFESGDVSENEGKGKQTLGSGKASSGAVAQSTAKTIVPPTVDVMRKQVAVEIHKQIDKLQKQAHKIAAQSQFSPLELNIVISQIRRLRDVLANLAYATAESLKTWWFEFVKGITV